jgi:hypothetical protein
MCFKKHYYIKVEQKYRYKWPALSNIYEILVSDYPLSLCKWASLSYC